MADVKKEKPRIEKQNPTAPSWQRVSRRIAATFLIVVLCGGLWYLWVRRSPIVPAPEKRTLFRGVVYRRDILQAPRPLVIHVTKIDLRAPGISFLVTPPETPDKLPLRAQTTSQFLEKSRAQIAINSDFFAPWHSQFLWDYYPHVGDPVQVNGMAVSRGREYSRGNSRAPVLVIGKNNRAAIFDSPQSARKFFPAGKIENAISGNTLLMRDGRAVPMQNWYKDNGDLHPRTAVALNKTRDKMIIFVVDGRQKNYSESVSQGELAALLKKEGADIAIGLDGGGSSTLAMQNSNGKASVLNSPIDNSLPGRERAVANHLAIFARPIS